MSTKKVSTNLIADMFKKTSQIVKLEEDSSGGSRIFGILDYIESEWGLAMVLYPTQRFIVKLYYNIPLDDKLPAAVDRRIRIKDPLTDKVRYEFTEVEYLRYLHAEGRCNIGMQDHLRRNLVLACGRRSGKCVTGDSLVLTDNGILRIEDISHASEDSFTPLDLGIAQECGRRARTTAFYNGGIKPVFSIKTKDGHQITGTGNHRVKVLNEEGCIKWRYLADVSKGDHVAINRGTDLWATKYLDLTPYHTKIGSKEVQLPLVLDETVGNFMGYLVGDGSWTLKGSLAITIEHPETWTHIARLFREILGEPKIEMDKRTQNTGCLKFHSIRARALFDVLGFKIGCDRDAKTFPWAILQSPKSVVCAFLRGLFEADGCAEKGGSCITFSSASFRLAHEVQVVLLNLGIVSSVRKKWVPKTGKFYANLSIKGVRSRKLFAELIGFDSEKKRMPMQNSLAFATEGKSNTDSIPNQLKPLTALLKTLKKNVGRSKLRVLMGNSCKPKSGEDLTYSRLEKCISIAKELGAGPCEIEHFEKLLATDYFYDSVVEVTHSDKQVYDLSVPDGVSFVANGITNHNTCLSGVFASYEIYRLLNLYNPREYYGVRNQIQIMSVATDKEQASLLFQEVASHIAKCDYFTPYRTSNTQSNIKLKTPHDIDTYGRAVRTADGKYDTLNGKTSLRVTFRPCIPKGLRGPGNIVIILDEVAHFHEKGGGSAHEVYKAVTPSAATFSRKDPETGMPAIDSVTGKQVDVDSRIILISSPLGKSGLFYEQFDLAMRGGEGSENMLAIQAPTWEINPTVVVSYYQQKYHEDPAAFSVEHGANFSDQTRGWIERSTDLTSCIDPLHRPKNRAAPRMPHQMGIDFGAIGDGAAVAITHIEEGKIVLDYHEIWYAGKDWRESNPHLTEHITDYSKTLRDQDCLDFDELANWIQSLCTRFYITAGIFDQWHGIVLEQSLHKKGLKQFTSEFFPAVLTSQMFQAVKMYMFDEKLKLYDYPIPETGAGAKTFGVVRHSPLIAELLSLQAKQISKNIVKVEAPPVVGAHDDQSDALVRSIWLSIQAMANQKHTSGNYGNNRPHASTGLNAQRYQAVRTRSHGVGPRTAVGGRILKSRG